MDDFGVRFRFEDAEHFDWLRAVILEIRTDKESWQFPDDLEKSQVALNYRDPDSTAIGVASRRASHQVVGVNAYGKYLMRDDLIAGRD